MYSLINQVRRRDLVLRGNIFHGLSFINLYLSVILPVMCIFVERGTYHLPRNSCEFLRFGGEVVSTCLSFQSRIFLFLCLLREFLSRGVLTTSLGILANSCVLGGGSKCVLFLSEPYLSVFVPVTCIFAWTGTYHLPRNSC